ncbi:PQQ-dependent sugar dehydrogenase [Pseudomonas citronellolis]|uniref:PQQ-dependent sugar dehydrogenase n=1 Tax=Pseudomonas citronellolis TaxID=53408 RepID=UPI0023E41DF0|nr:PQQ-dependent sugar dehydrogenase [Pseudomonas citronellolis]MDF3936857.1 PQQ-dependent sugar dehydrogenase [Pseudomonas citronellolis]
MCRSLVLLCLLLLGPLQGAQADSLGARIKVPPGFRVELLSDQLPSARAMAWGAEGTLFVGSNQAGKVYALRPGENQPKVIASDLRMPVGVAFHDGDLYVSAISRIYVLRDIESHLDAPPRPAALPVEFPGETHHGWKFIAFGPDGKLYVPVGAPCNICRPERQLYANLQRMKPDGGEREVVAYGIRNTVGFDWNARGELWFTDNGRDLLGDDEPDDELNRLGRIGDDFGYPDCHAGHIADPEFAQRPCSAFVPPVARLGAHVAALGMRFYDGQQFPAEYRGNVFIAEHGSWNSSRKVGYRVLRVELNDDGTLKRQSVFAEGWLQPGEQVIGRPADVLVAKDGSLLVSDDMAGAIYRISYVGNQEKSLGQ